MEIERLPRTCHGTSTYYWSFPFHTKVYGKCSLWGGPVFDNPHGCIGIIVYPRGEGLGNELLSRMLRDYTLEHPDVPHLYAWIHKDNARSQRLFAKHGFKRTGIPYDSNPDCEWWRLYNAHEY